MSVRKERNEEMKKFNDCKTLEELKKEYRKLAMKCHPDHGGSTEEMQKVNNAYEARFEQVKNIHVNQKGERYEKETQEAPSEFIDLIEKLMKMDGIEIEVIGCFVWISGETKPHKDALKEMGFKWHSKKLCWYLAPQDYKKRSRKSYSMNEIRDLFGVQFEGNGKGYTQLTA